MCGITGIVNLTQRTPVDPAVLAGMAQALLHRGPDDLAYYNTPGAAFGFRRLSILDLQNGAQPVHSDDGSITSMCNGEIYNFRTLRQDLIAKGYRFKTECDTEIIPAMYQAYGIDFLKKLNGQFAIAIYDHRRNLFYLARDHVGIAPLFYTQVGDAVLFASEIKALLKHPAVKPVLRLRGLDQILTFPGPVSPTTMFKGIYALKPGHYLCVRGNSITLNEYWDLDYPPADFKYDQPDEYYIERLGELVREAVKDRLMADVPVGYYISGGLDSSLVVALAHDISPDWRRHAFSIAFVDQQFDERRYQQMMAQHVNAERHEIEFNPARVIERLRDAVHASESPLKESYNTCSLALSQAAREHGVKVILTGEGADELFGGYVGYRFDASWRARYSQPATDPAEILEAEERARLWGDRALFYERDYYAFREIKRSLYAKPLQALFPKFQCAQPDLLDKKKLEGRDPFHKRSYLDFKLRLADHMLADHGDRVAYRNSIEARYPLIDIRVVEFARHIPARLKMNGMVEKYILRKMAERLLPPTLSSREKFHFIAPGSPELIAQNADLVNHYLSESTIKRQGLFDPQTVADVRNLYSRKGFKLNLPYEIDLLIFVLTTGIFVDAFKVTDIATQ